jgi:hypothetical protein
LNAVERDERQRSEGRCSGDFGFVRQTGQYDEVSLVRLLCPRQIRQPQLAIELPAVVVIAGHHHGATTGPPDELGYSLGDHRVPGNHSQDRAAVAGRVVAARLIVARDTGPGGHRRQERQPHRSGGFDRFGHVCRSVWADHRERRRVVGRRSGRLHRVAFPVRHMPHAGASKH